MFDRRSEKRLRFADSISFEQLTMTRLQVALVRKISQMMLKKKLVRR